MTALARLHFSLKAEGTSLEGANAQLILHEQGTGDVYAERFDPSVVVLYDAYDNVSYNHRTQLQGTPGPDLGLDSDQFLVNMPGVGPFETFNPEAFQRDGSNKAGTLDIYYAALAGTGWTVNSRLTFEEAPGAGWHSYVVQSALTATQFTAGTDRQFRWEWSNADIGAKLWIRDVYIDFEPTLVLDAGPISGARIRFAG